MSSRSATDSGSFCPVSASQIACTCDRTSDSLPSSMRGVVTLPPTIRLGRRKKYWSWLLPVVAYVITRAG